MPTKNDPARYRRLSEPHADADIANEAMTKFLATVEAAREQYRIPNVQITAQVDYLGEGGEEIAAHAIVMHLGDGNMALLMAAQTYGYYRREHDEQIDRMAGNRRAK